MLSQSSIKKDIDDVYFDALFIESDSALTEEYQKFAIKLFKNEGKLSDSVLKDRGFHNVGVSLIYKLKDNLKQDLELTLYALSYKDLRTKNFHKCLYFGRGEEGHPNFYVDYNTDEQKTAIDEKLLILI